MRDKIKYIIQKVDDFLNYGTDVTEKHPGCIADSMLGLSLTLYDGTGPAAIPYEGLAAKLDEEVEI